MTTMMTRSSLRRTRYHIYHYMLGRLTSVSGGRAFRLFTGRNYALNSLAQVLLEELHQQYTLKLLSDVGSRQECVATGGCKGPEVRISNPSPHGLLR
jgi:hypothetical protein